MFGAAFVSANPLSTVCKTGGCCSSSSSLCVRRGKFSMMGNGCTGSAAVGSPQPGPFVQATHVRSPGGFSAALAATPASVLVVVQVSKPGCRACIRATRTVAKLAEVYQGKVRFFYMDGYEMPELAQKMGIRAMPTFVVYRGGKRLDHVASGEREAIERIVEDYL